MAGSADHKNLGGDVGALPPVAPLGPLSVGNNAGTAATLWGGFGVPANTLGNNADFYFRGDPSGSHIYYKSGGTWAAIS
jgi:hypothetical protein